MAHESFEDEATAAVMNDLFVNIKVDREERPDVDAIYMGALHELGEHGGWPLTMFLTSDAEPFWGGTYFPKDARYGRPTFVSVLNEVARIYREEQGQGQAERRCAEGCGSSRRGGAAPRSPRPKPRWPISPAVSFRRSIRSMAALEARRNFRKRSSSISCGAQACVTASPIRSRPWTSRSTHIAQGGIYDHLGGGFSRYSTDERWLVPHFEKMLYDNAQLVELMTEAWRERKSPLYAQRIEETIDWLLREMVD